MENTIAVIRKTITNDLQVLKNRINGHDEDSDTTDKNLQHFLTMANKNVCRMEVALNKHQLTIKLLTKVLQHTQKYSENTL